MIIDRYMDNQNAIMSQIFYYSWNSLTLHGLLFYATSANLSNVHSQFVLRCKKQSIIIYEVKFCRERARTVCTPVHMSLPEKPI